MYNQDNGHSRIGSSRDFICYQQSIANNQTISWKNRYHIISNLYFTGTLTVRDQLSSDTALTSSKARKLDSLNILMATYPCQTNQQNKQKTNKKQQQQTIAVIQSHSNIQAMLAKHVHSESRKNDPSVVGLFQRINTHNKEGGILLRNTLL